MKYVVLQYREQQRKKIDRFIVSFVQIKYFVLLSMINCEYND